MATDQDRVKDEEREEEHCDSEVLTEGQPGRDDASGAPDSPADEDPAHRHAEEARLTTNALAEQLPLIPSA